MRDDYEEVIAAVLDGQLRSDVGRMTLARQIAQALGQNGFIMEYRPEYDGSVVSEFDGLPAEGL